MKVWKWMPLSLPLVLSGCASGPSNGTESGRRVIVTLRVSGRLNPGSAGNYFFLINTEPFDTTSGEPQSPLPIVAPSPTQTTWGNALAAGRYNYFVAWTGATREYRLYRVLDPSNPQNFIHEGTPVNFTTPDISQDANTLRFELLLSQIQPEIDEGTDPPPIDEIRFNFIATDKWGTNLSSAESKTWDALGDARNSTQINKPVRLNITTDILVNNTTRPPDPDTEPGNDVIRSNASTFENPVMPDLDIVDWQVEVRS